MDSEKFVQMLLVDSMYILTTFCGIATGQERLNPKHMMAKKDDTSRLFATSFRHNLFLLENQLPFFVLKKLHAFAYGNSERELVYIMKHKVADLLRDYAKADSEFLTSRTTDVHHLLHVCHMFFHPTIPQERASGQVPESSQMFRLESAVELYDTGVNFMTGSGSDQHSLLDITLSSSGKMMIPCLCVDDNTNSLLQNLIALEQMKYPSMGLDVSAYVVLLIHLITTPKDAQLLRRKEVILHHLLDKQMMYLVNKLSVGLSFDYVEDKYSLKSVFRDLNRYSRHRVRQWKAWLRHEYFNNPWIVVLLPAASILILYVVQAYYTVCSYYRPYFNGHR